VTLEPGTWDLTLLAVDPVSGSNRVYRGTVEPLPTGALRTSDLVLARALAPLPFATQASYDAPYIVGGFRVTPLVGTSLPRGEPVQIFYEIYGGEGPFPPELPARRAGGRRPLARPREAAGERLDGEGPGLRAPDRLLVADRRLPGARHDPRCLGAHRRARARVPAGSGREEPLVVHHPDVLDRERRMVAL
jgi:hypothetical protein